MVPTWKMSSFSSFFILCNFFEKIHFFTFFEKFTFLRNDANQENVIAFISVHIFSSVSIEFPMLSKVHLFSKRFGQLCSKS